MNAFWSALWVEALKARRSKASLLSIAAFLIFPGIDGLFMLIMKDPERARALGLIGVKAQLAAGTADWSTFYQVLLLGFAVGGAVLFAFITTWVFGREFSEHTVKEILALPTPRAAIVAAKFVLAALWILVLTLMVFGVGVLIGRAVDIPGWSQSLELASFWSILQIGLLTFMLMPFVALFASVGRGYLPPLGWAILTLALAQIAIVLGWGSWFPWSVPGVLGSMTSPGAEPLEPHSYILVLLTFIVGVGATLAWWQNADQVQ